MQATKNLSAKTILEPIQVDMKQLDEVIVKALYSDVPLINQISQYIISAGGKRLRPAIHLLLDRAFHSQTTECSPHAFTLAAVVEFIHTATLLHDDIVDESEMRRGRLTANASFGNAASVLVGDFLYSRAFQMMVKTDRLEVMSILAETTNIIAEGEVLQLLNVNDPNVDEERYLKVIHYKTAKLFEASAKLAAVINQQDEDIQHSCAAYGRHLGAAFQLVDDILDYNGDTEQLGKNVGDDLREGKPTLPLIYVMSNGNSIERQAVEHAIQNGGIEPDTSEFELIIQAIQKTGALEYTQALAESQATQAQMAIDFLAPSSFKQSLMDLARFAVQRRF